MENRNAYLMSRNAFLENVNAQYKALNERLINETRAVVAEKTELVKKNSDLKTDLEDAQEYYDDYSALWNKMVDQRDDEIERLTMVCSNIKHGKDAQIVALDKEVDALKAELSDVKAELDDEKVYTEKSLTYANATEHQLIMENYQLKTRIDVLTEMYESQSATVAAFNDMKKKLAEQTAMLASVSAKLIAVQDAVLSSSTYMAQVIATN
jgi:chromosome segregation ATPase